MASPLPGKIPRSIHQADNSPEDEDLDIATLSSMYHHRNGGPDPLANLPTIKFAVDRGLQRLNPPKEQNPLSQTKNKLPGQSAEIEVAATSPPATSPSPTWPSYFVPSTTPLLSFPPTQPTPTINKAAKDHAIKVWTKGASPKHTARAFVSYKGSQTTEFETPLFQNCYLNKSRLSNCTIRNSRLDNCTLTNVCIINCVIMNTIVLRDSPITKDILLEPIKEKRLIRFLSDGRDNEDRLEKEVTEEEIQQDEVPELGELFKWTDERKEQWDQRCPVASEETS